MSTSSGETINWQSVDLLGCPDPSVVDSFDGLSQADEFIARMGSQFLSLIHTGTTSNADEFSHSRLHWVNYANGSRSTTLSERFAEQLIEPMGGSIEVDEPATQVLLRRRMRGVSTDNPWLGHVDFNIAVPYRDRTSERPLGYAGLRVLVARGLRTRSGRDNNCPSESVVKSFQAGLATATTPDRLYPRVTTFAF